MLSKLKGMLGMKGKGASRGGGTVGSRSDVTGRSDLAIFEVTFSEKSLGLSLAARPEDGLPQVVDVANGSPASKAGVRPGLVLTHLDGNEIESFDSFNAICGAIGRPIQLRYHRYEESL